MKLIKYRIPLLMALFLAGLALFSIFSRKGSIRTGETGSAAMEEATLPVVRTESCGRTMDIMRGHLGEYEGDPASDTLIILPDDRKLPVTISDSSIAITGMRYEIRSLDRSNLIERTEIRAEDINGQEITAVLPIQNLIEGGKEYRLEIILTAAERGEIRYYARIMKDTTGLAASIIELAESFSERNFDYDTARENTTYLEGGNDGSDSLGFVDLSSGYDRLTYGNLSLTRVGEADLRLLEYNGSMGIVRRSFTAVSGEGDGAQSEFEIEENFIMRKGPERLYMMDYTRRMHEIFMGNAENFYNSRINLGVSEEGAVQAVFSPEKEYCAFVSSGDLWLLNTEAMECTRVWSFRSGRESGIRSSYGKHSVRALAVSSTGVLDLMVCGYMNRGAHEGRTGISVLSYDAASGVLKEKAFIASSRSFETLEEDMETLSFLNSGGVLYLKLDDGITGIDIRSGERVSVAGALKRGEYAVSRSGNMAAWQDTEGSGGSSVIHLMNFETGSRKELRSESGRLLKPLGFIGSDLVTGIASESDLRMINGKERGLPFIALEIVDDALATQAHYEESGIRISDVSCEGNRIHLTRLRKNGENTFSTLGGDTIVCNTAEEEPVSILTERSEERGRNYYIPLPDSTGKMVKIGTPKIISYADTAALQEENISGSLYTAYGRGKMLGSFEDRSDAINCAYDNMGYVRDGSRLVYCRAATASVRTLRNPDAAFHTLTEARNAGTEIDLFGAKMRAACYFVSRGKPVLAWSDGGVPLVIYGYDQASVLLYNAADGSFMRLSTGEAETMFEAGGNDFCIASEP